MPRQSSSRTNVNTSRRGKNKEITTTDILTGAIPAGERPYTEEHLAMAEEALANPQGLAEAPAPAEEPEAPAPVEEPAIEEPAPTVDIIVLPPAPAPAPKPASPQKLQNQLTSALYARLQKAMSLNGGLKLRLAMSKADPAHLEALDAILTAMEQDLQAEQAKLAGDAANLIAQFKAEKAGKTAPTEAQAS